jgi:hypothetical protein
MIYNNVIAAAHCSLNTIPIRAKNDILRINT